MYRVPVPFFYAKQNIFERLQLKMNQISSRVKGIFKIWVDSTVFTVPLLFQCKVPTGTPKCTKRRTVYRYLLNFKVGNENVKIYKQLQQLHRWASASRKLTPASAFRHQSSQSGTGPKNAGLKRFIPVPDQLRHPVPD
jgi:hypothetical protein